MKGLIISGGDIKDYDLLKEQVNESDYIVCADSGASQILKIGKYPDIVIGDLDSLQKEEMDILKNENVEIIKFPVMKDETDTELCIDYLFKNNIKNITLMGVMGTRFDHTLANVYLLRKINVLGGTGKILDKFNTIYYVDNTIELKKNTDYFISIIPISSEGVSISLSGFLYSINKGHLNFGSSKGISNKIIEKAGNIKIHKGEAFVIESKD